MYTVCTTHRKVDSFLLFLLCSCNDKPMKLWRKTPKRPFNTYKYTMINGLNPSSLVKGIRPSNAELLEPKQLLDQRNTPLRSPLYSWPWTHTNMNGLQCNCKSNSMENRRFSGHTSRRNGLIFWWNIIPAYTRVYMCIMSVISPN